MDEQNKVLLQILAELKKLNGVGFKINFLRGLIYGFGLSIGTSLVLAILIMILRNMVSVPIVGEYITEIIEFVEENSNKK